ncbi:MAG: hypothetical protein KBD78_04250 [Oligoflexales bacterium]|nr:hypothetical protein [Oligoflexales bacterium]
MSNELGLHTRNQGKAEAVRQGMLYALASGAKITGYWDADLATPVNEFLVILEAIQKDTFVTAVFGSRVRLLGHDIQRTLLRHYLGRGFATLASIILQLPVYDTQCGAKVFRCTEALTQSLETPFCSAWAFDIELIYRLLNTKRIELRLLQNQIREIPLKKWRDVKGSKLKPSAVFAVLLFLIRFGFEARILRKKF